MKKLLLIIGFFSLPLLLSAQISYTLSTNLPKEFDKLSITLTIKDDIKKYNLATKTTTVADGEALFTGTITAPSKNAVIEKKKEQKNTLQILC